MYLLLICQECADKVRLGGIPWSQTGVTQQYFHTKIVAIKGLVFCFAVWLGSMKGMVYRTFDQRNHAQGKMWSGKLYNLPCGVRPLMNVFYKRSYSKSQNILSICKKWIGLKNLFTTEYSVIIDLARWFFSHSTTDKRIYFHVKSFLILFFSSINLKTP